MDRRLGHTDDVGRSNIVYDRHALNVALALQNGFEERYVRMIPTIVGLLMDGIVSFICGSLNLPTFCG